MQMKQPKNQAHIEASSEKDRINYSVISRHEPNLHQILYVCSYAQLYLFDSVWHIYP